jgi:hypothetical protein
MTPFALWICILALLASRYSGFVLWIANSNTLFHIRYSFAAEKFTTIEGKIVIPNNPHPTNIPLVLNNGEYRTISRYDGSFVFRNVPSGN